MGFKFNNEDKCCKFHKIEKSIEDMLLKSLLSPRFRQFSHQTMFTIISKKMLGIWGVSCTFMNNLRKVQLATIKERFNFFTFTMAFNNEDNCCQLHKIEKSKICF